MHMIDMMLYMVQGEMLILNIRRYNLNFKNLIGGLFRDSTGMPQKVNIYKSRIKVYDEISYDVDKIEEMTINYFEETSLFDWKILEAEVIRLEGELKNGLISPYDYSNKCFEISEKKEEFLNSFISDSNEYFITAYKNRLYSIKNRYNNDSYISLMDFNSWFELKEARELAKLASLQIKSSDDYVDSLKIAEICERYRRNNHMRKGR